MWKTKWVEILTVILIIISLFLLAKPYVEKVKMISKKNKIVSPYTEEQKEQLGY